MKHDADSFYTNITNNMCTTVRLNIYTQFNTVRVGSTVQPVRKLLPKRQIDPTGSEGSLSSAAVLPDNEEKKKKQFSMSCHLRSETIETKMFHGSTFLDY